MLRRRRRLVERLKGWGEGGKDEEVFVATCELMSKEGSDVDWGVLSDIDWMAASIAAHWFGWSARYCGKLNLLLKGGVGLGLLELSEIICWKRLSLYCSKSRLNVVLGFELSLILNTILRTVLTIIKTILNDVFNKLKVEMQKLTKMNKAPNRINTKSTSWEHVWNSHNNWVVVFSK